MVYLRCLGASHEVGRSAFLLSTDKNFLFDYGIKLHDERTKEPTYPQPFQENLDAALISHAHTDHCGHVPFLYTFSKVPWFATPPTRDIAEIMFNDSMKIMGENCRFDEFHLKKALKGWKPVFYGKTFQMGQNNITYLDAGHILGSSIIEVEHQKKKVVYTGDLKLGETRMHKGARMVEDTHTLIIEGTYALEDHPDRNESEKKLIERVEETLADDGNVLLPAFALGRSQELIGILGSHFDSDVPIYLDGMSKKITEVYLKYPYYLDHFDEFEKALEKVDFVYSYRDRKKALKEPGIIISTAGMLEGGPAISYLMNLNQNSRIIFTGYCVEGTNGWRLQNKGKIIKDEYELDVSLPVEYIDFSAHAGRSDLLKFIKKANPEKVVVVHTDPENCDKFVKDLRDDFGFNAIGPYAGDKIELY